MFRFFKRKRKSVLEIVGVGERVQLQYSIREENRLLARVISKFEELKGQRNGNSSVSQIVLESIRNSMGKKSLQFYNKQSFTHVHYSQTFQVPENLIRDCLEAILIEQSNMSIE